MQKITPFLWFDNNAEEAIAFYASIFKDSSIETITRYAKDTPGQEGTVMTGSFTLYGQRFSTLNGGPVFKFTPAISFVVNCEDQAEVDYYWESLSAGGEKGQCGWLTDKFGVSWQIVPTLLGKLLNDKNVKKVYNATQAMLKMTKLEIDALQRAFDRE